MIAEGPIYKTPTIIQWLQNINERAKGCVSYMTSVRITIATITEDVSTVNEYSYAND